MTHSRGATEYHNPPEMGNRLIRTIAEDKYGNVWLGSPNGGVYKWAPEHALFNFDSGFSKRYSLPSTQVEKITTDSKGFVWICTLDGWGV